jgi:hypothetical protein
MKCVSARLACVAVMGFLGALARQANAQSTPTTPATIDTSLGPIVGGTRYIGLSGAYVAIAEGNEGIAINPASDAVRLGYSWHQWDEGVGIDVSIGAWLPKNDIYNQPASSGSKKSTAFFGSLGLNVYYEYAGLGVAAEAQSNAATSQTQAQGIAPTQLSANYGMVHASLAYGFYSGQLVLGAGPRFVGMRFGGGSSSSSLFSTAGVGYEAGVIVKPTNSQYRIAAAAKSPVTANAPGADSARPTKLHVPWEAALGFAYQFGGRPLNPRFTTVDDVARERNGGREPSKAELEAAERELFDRYERRERVYLLVSTELALVQSSGAQIGLNALDSLTSSTRPLVSPRLGLESEVVPHHLKLRAGSYYESARLAQTNGRVHGTGGADIRLFEWSAFGLLEPFDFWQLSLGADGARSYLNTSISIGFWH